MVYRWRVIRRAAVRRRGALLPLGKLSNSGIGHGQFLPARAGEVPP